MMFAISAGVTAWALLCWFLIAVLSASARHRPSTLVLASVPHGQVPAISPGTSGSRLLPTSAGRTAFTLDLDPYGLDASMRRLVAASVTPSK